MRPEPEKPSPSLPPQSDEEKAADAALDAACVDATAAAQRLHETSKRLKRTISDSKMKAVRLPTPSQLELEHPPSKR